MKLFYVNKEKITRIKAFKKFYQNFLIKDK